MKSISAKLFLAFLGLTSVVLIATLLLARWSFDQGFLDYINSQHQRRLIGMADDLSEYYVKNNHSWESRTHGDIEHAYHSAFKKWFPRPRGKRPPPNQGLSERDSHRLQYASGHSFKPQPFKANVALFDTDKKLLAGEAVLLNSAELLVVDVTLNGVKIAELQTIARMHFDSSYESQFSEQQTKASIIIALLSLLFAGFASWLLSKFLLAPTVRMRSTISALVKGDYQKRIDVSRNDELGVLMNDVNHLARTLEKNQQSRKQWLADISHELRTPVAILSGEIDAMLDGIRPLGMEGIESLDHEVGRLKHLIDDLYQLSLSDIGGLRYEFETMSLSDHLATVLAQFRTRIESSGLLLNIELQDSVFIEGDNARLEQLFVNLINNSIDYTDSPGELALDLSVSEQRAVVTISDSAPGIEPDKLQHLFEPLFRGEDSRNRQVGGAGLGLTICRNIVSAHSGDIEAKSSPMGGLEFKITLPLVNQNKRIKL